MSSSLHLVICSQGPTTANGVTETFQWCGPLQQQVRVAIQQLTPQRRQPEAAGQPLAIDFPSQHSDANQPAQIVFQVLGVVAPAFSTAVARLVVPESFGIQSLILQIPIERIGERQAAHCPCRPVATPIAQ